jgi:hypothetical protein
MGKLIKPNSEAMGVNGNIKTNKTISAAAMLKYLPGKLLKKGNRNFRSICVA